MKPCCLQQILIMYPSHLVWRRTKLYRLINICRQHKIERKTDTRPLKNRNVQQWRGFWLWNTAWMNLFLVIMTGTASGAKFTLGADITTIYDRVCGAQISVFIWSDSGLVFSFGRLSFICHGFVSFSSTWDF